MLYDSVPVYGYHARRVEAAENIAQQTKLREVFGELEMTSHFIFKQMSNDLTKIEGRVK